MRKFWNPTPPAGGVLVRFTEMAPGAESPMRRTETVGVGVGVVLEGEARRRGSETRGSPRLRGRPARHDPRLGEPVRPPRPAGVRDDRRRDHGRAGRGRRAVAVLRQGARLTGTGHTVIPYWRIFRYSDERARPRAAAAATRLPRA